MGPWGVGHFSVVKCHEDRRPLFQACSQNAGGRGYLSLFRRNPNEEYDAIRVWKLLRLL